MEKINKTITLFRQPSGRYKADPLSLEVINSNISEKIVFEQISESRGRSLQQHRAYWSAWLPTFSANIQGMENYVIAETNGALCYDVAHRFLTLKWAIAKQRTDMIETVPCIQNGKIEHVGIVSLSFGKCKQSDAQDYFDWLHATFFKVTGKELDQFIAEQEMHA